MSKLEEIGARSVESVFLGNLANLYFHHSYFEKARETYEAANAMFEEADDKLNLAYFRAFYAALIAEENRIEEAQGLISYADKALKEIGDDLGVVAVSVCEGMIYLARARLAMESGDIRVAAAHLQIVNDRIENVKKKGAVSELHPEGAPSLAEKSGDVRDGLRFLEASMFRYEKRFRIASA